jgi:DHA1 family inner membrane transport protein
MTLNAAGSRPELDGAALLRLACAYAVATSGTILMPLIVAMLMRRFDVGEGMATGMAGLEILGIAISCALLPSLVARAPRRFACIGALGTLVGQAAGAWLPDVVSVGAARGVAGLFEGVLFVVVAAALSNRAAAERAWGVIILVGGVFDGALLMAAACLPHAADRWLLPGFAAAFSLIVIPTARAGRHAVDAASPGAAGASAAPPAAPRWATLVPIWVVMILVYGVLASQWAIADVLGQRAGIAPAQTGLVLSLASVIGLAGCLAASHRRSHALRLPIIRAAQLAMAAAVAWFFIASGATAFFLAQLLVTLAFYAITPFLTARLSELDADGALVARSIVITFTSVALGTALAGTLLAGLGALGCGLALGACALASIPFARAAFPPAAGAAPAAPLDGPSGPIAAPTPEAS